MNVANQLKDRITAVHRATDDIRSRFTTPAKLKNFDYDDARMKELEDGILAMRATSRALDFYVDTLEVLKYISMAETRVPEDNALHEAFTEKKALLMQLRDRILEEDYDTDDTDELIAQLADLQNAYIAYYMDAHKQYRLDHAGATKKGKIQQSETVKALQALRNIRDILPLGQFNDLLARLASVKVCYECTTPELHESPDCPHCHFNPADHTSQPVAGSLEFIEDRLDDLLAAWTARLLTALEDPMLENQKALLAKNQQQTIERFMTTRQLPMPVDQQFIDAVNAMLSGMISVELPMDALHQALLSWSPCAPDECKARLAEWIDARTRGMDKSKVRIVVK